VLLLVEDEDEIAGLEARVLIRPPSQDYPMAVRGALLDVHLDDLADPPERPVPPGAGAGGAGPRPVRRAQRPDAGAAALLARLELPGLVDDAALDGEPPRAAQVELLERHGERMHNVPRPPPVEARAGAALAAAAEEKLEDIHGVGARKCGAAVAVRVIGPPLLVIAEDLVRVRNLLETLQVASRLVWMVLHRQLPVRLSNVRGSSSPV